MKIENWSIDRPIPYARNARKISLTAVEKVAASIKEFGWRQPIVVDAEGVVVVGHARLEAAKKLGLDTVPVHIATDLTKAQIKAYRLADNRTGQETQWDFELLAIELGELKDELDFDLDLTGFDDTEVSELLADGSFPDSALDDSEDEKPQPSSKDKLNRAEAPSGDDGDKVNLALTKEQHESIGSAIFRLRDREKKNISDGEALVLICGHYLTSCDYSLLESSDDL
jgi:ParB-like chromosome segregation protein Spo0J